MTTFATLALQRFTVPWNSNAIERVMGTVGKRAMPRWMSWTTAGSQGLLALLVTRAVKPRTHEPFWRRELFGHLSPRSHRGIEVALRRSRAQSWPTRSPDESSEGPTNAEEIPRHRSRLLSEGRPRRGGFAFYKCNVERCERSFWFAGSRGELPGLPRR